jgi:hypothetical protein
MAEYKVTWTMELDAESHLDAAQLALSIHRDPHSEATCFWVEKVSTGEKEHIDLLEDDYDGC